MLHYNYIQMIPNPWRGRAIMEQDRQQRKMSLGKKLLRLHAWNGWLVLALAVSGLILFIPALRGDFGSFGIFLPIGPVQLYGRMIC
ncbi:MAG: hypothetical protein K0Q59_3044 [Paenibacillus sp.]|nr:hypothetical protein [Paenibacillus sp.]